MAQQSAENKLTEAETFGFMREWIHENPDLMVWELIMQDLAKTAKSLPNNSCGQCAAYKTPFCMFASYNDVIRKKDQCCASFYLDRHLFGRKLKRRIVQKRVE